MDLASTSHAQALAQHEKQILLELSHMIDTAHKSRKFEEQHRAGESAEQPLLLTLQEQRSL